MKYTFSKKYGADSLMSYLLNPVNNNGFIGSISISEDTGVSVAEFAVTYTADNTVIPMNTEVLPTKESIESAMVAFEASEVARENRRKAYPRIVDQLDDIYHNGIDGWKTAIKAIKDANPKA